ncbi:MAG: type I-U CRISPR-associated protein Csx17 [Gemmatimonadetes bacterium]|nr:type I-U CRISPR-associated protein Csx17 [Gemmatimonadota bacterium]
MAADGLRLEGCSPTPLSSYLKALGTLRIISSAINSAFGKAADASARGWWQDERLHLRTSLGRDDLLSFFLKDYAPSPVIAPWNGGSGFYPEDNRDGFGPLSSPEVATRFALFSEALRIATETLGSFGLPLPVPDAEPDEARKPRTSKQARLRGAVKKELVAALRGSLPPAALPWLDAALVLTADGLRFPPLLGTGGNDGRLDFTTGFMQRLVSNGRTPGLFNATTGDPSFVCAGLLENSLFGSPIQDLTDAAVGQFSPGSAGGPNASTGYEGDATVNPWDFVLMLEGAVTFASAATRRHQSNALSRASAPFTVGASGAGWGGVSNEADARAEFWAPIWTRPARFIEVRALFAEGRATSGGRTASDGLDFARALATLGVNRGFSEFQRFGFFQRAGKSYYAAALDRRRAAPSNGAALVADLDRGGWLGRIRRSGRKDNQPAATRNAIKTLEDSLFSLLEPECPPSSVRAAIEAVGRLARLTGDRPSVRETVAPPPLLSRSWLLRADDGSPEFRVAAAIAGIGIPSTNPGRSSGSTGLGTRYWRIPPMAAHLAPLTDGGEGFERSTFFRGWHLRRRRNWSTAENPPTVVWGHGELMRNLVAVLERRIVETSVRGLDDKPFAGASFARLSDVGAFLTADFDDDRCQDLLAGMVWADPVRFRAPEPRAGPSRATLPFAYSALKPIFAPNDQLRRIGAIPTEGAIPVPPNLLASLRAGGGSRDGRAVGRVVRLAFARVRSSGLISAYDSTGSGSGANTWQHGRIGVGIRPDRLAAALLIPVADRGLTSLLRRAYPGALPDSAHLSPEETTNAD